MKLKMLYISFSMTGFSKLVANKANTLNTLSLLLSTLTPLSPPPLLLLLLQLLLPILPFILGNAEPDEEEEEEEGNIDDDDDDDDDDIFTSGPFLRTNFPFLCMVGFISGHTPSQPSTPKIQKRGKSQLQLST